MACNNFIQLRKFIRGHTVRIGYHQTCLTPNNNANIFTSPSEIPILQIYKALQLQRQAHLNRDHVQHDRTQT